MGTEVVESRTETGQQKTWQGRVSGDADRLMVAISKLTGRTIAAKLRPVMPEIHEKVEQGVSYEQILTALREGGLEVKRETLRKYLYRFRLERQGAVNPAGITSARSAARVGPEPEKLEPPVTVMSSFEDAIDPRKRGTTGEHYATLRKPIINRKGAK